MGLDMYLERKTYIGNKYRKPEEQLKIVASGKLEGVKQERVTYITEEVGYWRKANAIHKWFIENCNDGDDDNCKPLPVSKEDLKTLLDLVNRVLEASVLVKAKIGNGYSFDKEGKKVPILEDGELIDNPETAIELLPTTDGFFFGSTDYDQYYIEDLKQTKKIIEDVLADEGDGELYYEASW